MSKLKFNDSYSLFKYLYDNDKIKGFSVSGWWLGLKYENNHSLKNEELISHVESIMDLTSEDFRINYRDWIGDDVEFIFTYDDKDKDVLMVEIPNNTICLTDFYDNDKIIKDEIIKLFADYFGNLKDVSFEKITFDLDIIIHFTLDIKYSLKKFDFKYFFNDEIIFIPNDKKEELIKKIINIVKNNTIRSIDETDLTALIMMQGDDLYYEEEIHTKGYLWPLDFLKDDGEEYEIDTENI